MIPLELKRDENGLLYIDDIELIRYHFLDIDHRENKYERKEQNEFYKKYFFNKCIYIPNFLEHITSYTSSLIEKRILFVGILSKDKGIYDLINVFKKINEKHHDWTLDIVGGGVEYNNLLKS